MLIDWLCQLLSFVTFLKKKKINEWLCLSNLQTRIHRDDVRFQICCCIDCHVNTQICTHACMHAQTHGGTHTAAISSSVISALISPCGRLTRGMIPLLRILIGFWWLHWGTLVSGHLPNHPAVMTQCTHWFYWCHWRHDAATAFDFPCKCHKGLLFFHGWFDEHLLKEKFVGTNN